MICSYCVFIMPDDSKYCPSCGRPTPLVGDVVDVIRTPQAVVISTLPPAVETNASVASLPSAKPQTPHADIELQLSTANIHRLRKEWDKAADMCATVLEMEPSNPTAHSLLGDICKEQNRLEDAHRWYRMAVTLKPNASDQTKLKTVEALLAKKQSGGTQVLNQKIVLPVHADGSVVSGTTQLAGVSPRRWLKAITLVSVVFMGITVVVLGAFQMGKRQNSALPKPLPATSYNSNLTPAPLPNQRPTVSPAPLNPPPSTPPSSEGGTGFLPDKPRSGTPQTQPSTNPPTPPSVGSSSPTLPGLKPATVLSVMEHPTAIQLKAPEESSDDTTHLPGEMWIGNIQKDAKLPQAIIEIESPLKDKEALNDDQKRLILRNVYRAAERVSKAEPSLTALGFMVMANGDKPSERTPLFYAELEPKSLASIDIEKASMISMTEGLRDHKWVNTLDVTPSSPQVASTPSKTPPAQPTAPKPYVYIEFAPTKSSTKN